MKDYKFKMSDILDTNMSLISPCFPLAEHHLNILIKNNTDLKSWADKSLAISFGAIIRVIAQYGVFFSENFDSNVQKDQWPDIYLDIWIIMISLVLGAILYIFHCCIPTNKKKLIKQCREFYNKKA